MVKRGRYVGVIAAAVTASVMCLFWFAQGVPAQVTTDQEGEHGLVGVKSGKGSVPEQGVAAEFPEQTQQARPDTGQKMETPAPGLTEKGKADLERARRGEAQPADKERIKAPEERSAQEALEAPPSEAPTLGASFQGVSHSGFIPPDPIMAAGPNNIVVAANGAINVFQKNGTLSFGTTLQAFFSSLGPEHTFVFDPWVAYDPYINRFWVVGLSLDTTAQRGDILVALSNTSDASAGFSLWELDSTRDGPNPSSNWCDYEKLGFDSQAVYLTCNQFAFAGGGFQYSKIRIMTKSQFVNNTAIDYWDFWNLRDGNTATGAPAFTIQPAQMFGATNANGMYMVSARGGGGTGSALDVWRFTNPQNCCNGSTIGPTANHAALSVGSFGPSDGARQSGSTTQIHNGDARLLYAFWKGGKLSTGHTVACGVGGGDACAGYNEINVAAFPTLSSVNDWVYGAAGADYYYPAVSVNASDNKTMVFSRSSPTDFAGTRYVGIPSSTACTLCIDGPETVLRDGQASYVSLDGIGRNRWGDYLGASPDPDGRGIWVAGEFAATGNQWGVQVGLTSPAAPPPADRIPPSVALTAPAANAIVRGTAVTISANAADNVRVSRVEFLVNGRVVGTDTTAPYSVRWNSRTISDGFVTVTARAFDAANNVRTSVGRRLIVDNTFPNTIINSAVGPVQQRTFRFSSTERNSTFRCSIDSRAFVVCSSPRTYILPRGTHTFRVYAVGAAGAAGDRDSTPAVRTWRIP